MLRIAKIVVIYKNNTEENNNRFSCCSEYTYRLHLLPWVAKAQPILLFCAGVRRGESGECNPSYFSKTLQRVFRRFATKFSVRYVYLLLPYPLLILKSQLSRLMTCDLILNSQCQDKRVYVPQRLYSLSHIENRNEVNESWFVPGTLEIYGLLRIK